MKQKIINFLKPKLELAKGTRFISFLFIGLSILIAAGILWGANIYYNIDTGEIVMEEIQRVTGVLRATAGAIVGGTDSQNPDSGYAFQVVGSSKLATTTFSQGNVELIAANQWLKFTGGTSYYVGLRASTSLSTTSEYILPTSKPTASDYYLTVDPATGQMSWGVPSGAGDISAVGDVETGAAFTAAGSGSTLWFHSGANLGALTIATLTGNATYTLPAVTGNNSFLLASAIPSAGQILYGAGSNLITGSSDFTWSAGSRYLQLGSSGNNASLRIYSNNANYLAFAPTSSLGSTVTYTWPTAPSGANYVLTSDPSGNLSWTQVSGVGGVTGTGSAGYVAYWNGSNSITYDSAFAWNEGTDTLTIGGTIIANTFRGPDGSPTNITSATGQNIVLDPASGRIVLGSGDWIQTNSGYDIGRAGTQVLREMIPIMGFDLPAQTATTSYIAISRVLEDYPFSPAATGTTRVHKFIIRYADATTTDSSNWRVYNVTGSSVVDTFTVPASASTDLEKGESYITDAVDIPTNTDDWRLELQTSGATVRVYQIFLAAYDQIQ